jgi:DNA-directed RNA polymerase subunit E'/Rpb7
MPTIYNLNTNMIELQMIPSDITFDGQASPPHWSNKEGDVIEKGTHVRVRLKGVRPNLGSLFAIATINEDFLGYEITVLLALMTNMCL